MTGVEMITIVDIVLLAMLCLSAVAIMLMRHLFAVAALSGAFSLLSAGLLVALDAVDVAFTEAAVGAGISMVLVLSTLALTSRREKIAPRLSPAALLVVILTGATLIYATSDMPAFGDPNAPALKHVIPTYIDGSKNDIGVPNIVTSVLASYRGYDTLGEVAVIFTAGIGVIFLLGARREDEDDEGAVQLGAGSDDIWRDNSRSRRKLVLRVVSKMLIPFILLFALYVQFHGDFGPGGGFQAGVIFAAAFILYALVFGVEYAQQVLPPKALRVLVPLGLLLYTIIGFACLFMGGKFLDYDVLAHDPQHGQHLGIIVIEFGVGITVAAVMVSVFYAYSGRARGVDDEDW